MNTTPQDIKTAVHVIKSAILQSQMRAVKAINQEQLALYYGIGRYVSMNSRKGFWGKGAIKSISEMLRRELPGLRGFSEASLKKMRTFYEEWQMIDGNSFVATNELETDGSKSLVSTNEITYTEIGKTQFTLSEDFPVISFMSIGFTLHYSIISKVKDIEQRKFYIQLAHEQQLNVEELGQAIANDFYGKQGHLANNFNKTIPDALQAYRAIQMFKDDYLLDFINVEELFVRDKKQDEKYIEDEMAEAIQEHYKTKQLTAIGRNAVNSKLDVVNSNLYVTPEDRDVAKVFVSDTIKSVDKLYSIDVERKNQKTFNIHQLNNRRGLAYELIDHSKIHPDDKTVASLKVKVATTINEVNNVLKEYEISFPTNNNVRSKYYYKNRVIKAIEAALFKRIENNTSTSKEDFLKNISKMTEDEILNLFGTEISYQNKNFVTMYLELRESKSNKNKENGLFEEALEGLSYITFYDVRSEDKVDDDNRVFEELAQSKSDVTKDDTNDTETSIVAAYDHTGLVTDALSTIDSKVKTHLSSLKKLNSTKLVNGQYDFNRNNALGVTEGIDIHKAYQYLYYEVFYTDINTMIKSIELIAETHPDMAAFKTLADELKADDVLANLYWNTFAKLVINKSITKSNPSGNSWYISNSDCDIKTSLQNKYLNSVRQTSYTTPDGNYWKTKVNLAQQLLRNIKPKWFDLPEVQEIKANTISDVVKIVRAYYPCIEDRSIKTFIELYKTDTQREADPRTNCLRLLDILSKTIDEAIKVYKDHNETIDRLETLRRFNNKIDKLIDTIYRIRKKEGITRDTIKRELEKLDDVAGFEYVKKYIKDSLANTFKLNLYRHVDLSGITKKDYTTTELRKQAIELASIMLKFSPVNT